MVRTFILSSTSFKICLVLLGTWVTYDATGNPLGPELDGYSAGNYDVDNTTMYIGSADNSGCYSQTIGSGRLTTKAPAGLYMPCSTTEQYKTTGVTYLLYHPNLVICLISSRF